MAAPVEDADGDLSLLRRTGEWVRRHPVLWAAARRVRAQSRQVLPPFRYEGLGQFHRGDTMFQGYGRPTRETAVAYLESGRATVQLISDHLAAAGVEDTGVEQWFEIGAGYGRLVRALVERVPAERVWAMELDRHGRDFVAQEFGVHPVGSSTRFDTSVPVRADAAFAISVITHVDSSGTEAFLTCVRKALAPGGAVLFTSHGRASVDRLAMYDDGRYVPQRTAIDSGLAEEGIAYLPYGLRSNSLGMTWHHPDHLREVVARCCPDFELVSYVPGGLDEHQDIWVYRRPPSDT